MMKILSNCRKSKSCIDINYNSQTLVRDLSTLLTMINSIHHNVTLNTKLFLYFITDI